MFRVAICDDEATSLKLNTMLTEKILNEEGIVHEIKTFEDMESMINAVTKPKSPFDVLYQIYWQPV